MARSAVNEQVDDDDLIGLFERHSDSLAAELQAHHLDVFPPSAVKGIRNFAPSEAAKLIGIGETYLRALATEVPGIEVAIGPNGRRAYSVEDMHKIRHYLHQGNPAREYLPGRRQGDELQVISIVNFKGGSGKTTTSAHLAQHLALRGYRVLAIDLDPQASLSTLFGVQPETDVGTNDTIYGAIRYDEDKRSIEEIIRATYIPHLHLIPGNLELMEFEHDTPRALMDRDRGHTMFFNRIREALAPVEADYDVVIVDCPPQLGFLTISSLTASSSVLVTVHPQMLDVMSMNQFLAMTSDLLRGIAKHAPRLKYKWMRYLVTRFEPSDGPQNQMVAYLRSIFGKHVLNFPMLKTTAVSDAGLTNQTLYEVEAKQFSKSTYDRALDAMNNVNDEIETLIKKAWGRAV